MQEANELIVVHPSLELRVFNLALDGIKCWDEVFFVGEGRFVDWSWLVGGLARHKECWRGKVVITVGRLEEEFVVTIQDLNAEVVDILRRAEAGGVDVGAEDMIHLGIGPILVPALTESKVCWSEII